MPLNLFLWLIWQQLSRLSFASRTPSLRPLLATIFILDAGPPLLWGDYTPSCYWQLGVQPSKPFKISNNKTNPWAFVIYNQFRCQKVLLKWGTILSQKVKKKIKKIKKILFILVISQPWSKWLYHICWPVALVSDSMLIYPQLVYLLICHSLL